MQQYSMVYHGWSARQYQLGEQVLQAGDAYQIAEQCLKDTGAIKSCSGSAETYLVVKDESAGQEAYARAEHLRRAGLRGFRGMPQEEVANAIKKALAASLQAG